MQTDDTISCPPRLRGRDLTMVTNGGGRTWSVRGMGMRLSAAVGLTVQPLECKGSAPKYAMYVLQLFCLTVGRLFFIWTDGRGGREGPCPLGGSARIPNKAFFFYMPSRQKKMTTNNRACFISNVMSWPSFPQVVNISNSSFSTSTATAAERAPKCGTIVSPSRR